MRTFRSFIGALGVAVILAGTASADVFHNFQFKLGVSEIAPDVSSTISTIGGKVNISNQTVPTLGIEYFFTDHISTELLCCAAQHNVDAVGTALGRVDLGKVTHFPPTLTLKYRWTELGRFQPYVGAGANYTRFFDHSLPAGGPVTSISYKSSTGGALQAGADYKLDDHWALNFDVRRIWINTHVDVRAGATDVPAKVGVDPWVVTAAVGYRF